MISKIKEIVSGLVERAPAWAVFAIATAEALSAAVLSTFKGWSLSEGIRKQAERILDCFLVWVVAVFVAVVFFAAVVVSIIFGVIVELLIVCGAWKLFDARKS